MTKYTDLLKAAMKVAIKEESCAEAREDKAAWNRLNRSCRKELFRLTGKIEPLSKKRLDKDS